MTVPPQLYQAQTHFHARRFHEAEVTVRQLLQQQPDLPDAWMLLARLAQEAGQAKVAQEFAQKTLALQADHAEAKKFLTVATPSKDLSPAQQEHERGLTFVAAKNYEQAIVHFREAIRLQPDYGLAYNSLGNSYKHIGRLREAIAAFHAGLMHHPAESALCSNLGETLRMLCDFNEATVAYRTAMRTLPPFSFAHANYLVMCNYDPDHDAKTLFEEHRAWGDSAAVVLKRTCPTATDAKRKLRLGYISPDFMVHPVARFLEPILVHHDRTQFDVYLYGEVPHPDDVTRRFQSLATSWHNTVKYTAGEVATKVREDRIDLLIDLSGHYSQARIDVLAQQPAPIQITYLGYPNTTGLSGIDYWLTDSVVNPPDRPALATEQIVYLEGGFSCFQPPEPSPPVNRLPALQRGTFTFGAHHGLQKFHDDVLRTWARLLHAVPNSRLLFLRGSHFPPILEYLRTRFAVFDIAPQRIETRRYPSYANEYLKGYHEMDVILDTWPFGGHTMTCEALWMGVPLVTLVADRPCGRLSASILTSMGKTEWIARSHDEYLSIARRLTTDLPALDEIRQSLRVRTEEALCNGLRFTRNLECVYRLLWERAASGDAAPSEELKQLLHPGQGVRPTPKTTDAVFQETQRLYSQGKLPEAESLTRRLLAADAEHAGAWRLMALMARTAGRIPLAVENMTRAVHLAPREISWQQELTALRQMQR